MLTKYFTKDLKETLPLAYLLRQRVNSLGVLTTSLEIIPLYPLGW